MKKKDINLFNKTIHEVKYAIVEIAQERQKYHENISKLRQEQKAMRKIHDKSVKKQIRELKQAINNLYKLFDDLSNGEGK